MTDTEKTKRISQFGWLEVSGERETDRSWKETTFINRKFRLPMRIDAIC